VVVLEDNKQLKKYAAMAKDLPHLKAIVIWAEEADPELVRETGKRVYSWSDFLVLGVSVSDAAIEARQAGIKPGNCSTLIYTSGTTGPPKAVMISHDNVTWTTKTMLDNYMDVNHTERFVSYLPLSHIAAQLIDVHAPMYLGAATYFAQPDALKGSLTNTLKDCRPTIFFGVPRVWEKIQEKMVQIGRESTGIKKVLGTWAKNCGSEKNRLAQYGNGGGAPCGYGCANSLILSKIKEALGLDQTKACFTAAAPIAPDTLYYFASLDIPIYEVFGQSECTGPHTVSCEGNWKIGYCGRPMLGTETMIAPGTNELCYRGRHIFMGYMYMPDKTAETIDEQGYLHSGDVAEFDDNADPRVPAPSGFMKITGRIKELIITAGGENIPPVLIENEMKAAMVALSNCMVVGDRRKFLTMLVSLKCEVNPETGAPTDRLAADALFVGQQIGSEVVTMEEAAKCPKWKEYIDKGIKEANKKTTSNAQIVQKWVMLPVDFSEKAGDLTPTLKLKRNVVSDKYAQLIENMYADVENL
jgi:long-chain-fatty-acid--CoA ligase ACSBG